MARSRPGAATEPAAAAPPSSSRLTMRARKNRRRAPAPTCGRASRRRARSPMRAAARCAARCRRSSRIAALGRDRRHGVVRGYRFVTTSPRFAITDDRDPRQPPRSPDDADRARCRSHVGDNVFADERSTRVAAACCARTRGSRAPTRTAMLPHTLVDRRPRARRRRARRPRRPLPRRRRRATRSSAPSSTPATAPGCRSSPASTAPRTLADPDGDRARDRAARSPRSRPGARAATAPRSARSTSIRAARSTLHTYDGAHRDPARRARRRRSPRACDTFDAAWAELADAERARARAIHLDTRPDHVTVAFAKDL